MATGQRRKMKMLEQTKLIVKSNRFIALNKYTRERIVAEA